MEQIINKYIKVFYIVMIVVHLQFIIKTINFNPIELVINVIAFMNLFLYILLYIYNIDHKYTQTKVILEILAISTIILYIPMTILECFKYGMISYILINTGLQHFLIEFILFLRISTIKRLEDISKEKGDNNG